MKWRRISEEEVRKAVIYPDRIESSTNDRKNAFKFVNNRWLKVTFKKEKDLIIVITVIDKGNKDEKYENRI